MQRLTDNKIILVTRPTRLAELTRRFATRLQARFYVSHLGQDFTDYEQEDERYASAVRATRQTLEALGRVQRIDRDFLPNFVFGPQDTVVVLGQDGLVANTVKYLAGQPVIGVNPDPARWDGQLLPFQVADLARILPEVFARRRPMTSVTMAQATLNTGATLYAVNDIFVGPRTHLSARYTIRLGDRTEPQSSSGVIVSTGMGSTGWLKSLLAGAAGIMQGVGSPLAPAAEAHRRSPSGTSQKSQPPQAPSAPVSGFPWDADYLYFTVREPFPSKTTRATLVFGRVTAQQPLVLISQMPEHAVIFSDGIEADFLEFRSGTKVTIGLADKAGCLVL